MKFEPLRRAALTAGALLAATGLWSVSGSAHHSTAMFEWGDEVRLDDLTVERWVWTNPHTFIYAHDSQGNRWRSRA